MDYSAVFNDAVCIPRPMVSLDLITFSQLAAIRQITLDETWLEAERRGCCVSTQDRVVRDNVCRVVLRNGAQLRESAQRAIASAPAMIPFPTEPKAA